MPKLEAVDLSSNNRGVEYAKLHADGCRYAWIRVNDLDTADHMDTAHHAHRQGCQAAGIKAFPYWVAHPSLNPNTEGGLARQHCLSDVWDTHPVSHAPLWALDWEEAGLTLAWAQSFGQPPVLYRSASHENVFPDARQWIADWGLATRPIVKHLIAWQWTDALHGYRSDGGPLDASEVYIVDPVPPHDPTPPHHRDFQEKVLHRLHLIHLDVHVIAEKIGIPPSHLAALEGPTPPTPGSTPLRAVGSSESAPQPPQTGSTAENPTSATGPGAAPEPGATPGAGDVTPAPTPTSEGSP